MTLYSHNLAFLHKIKFIDTGVMHAMYIEMPKPVELDSRNRIQSALLSLMEEYPYSRITVSQICQVAKVSRQTYYRLFDTKDDILILCLHEIMSEYLLPMILLRTPSTQELLQFFLFFSGCRNLLELLYKNDKMYLLQHTLTQYSNMFINEPIFRIAPGYDYAAEFVASTLCSVLAVWAKMEFKTSCSTLANYTAQFFKGIR